MDVVNVSGSDTGQLGYAIPRWAWKIKRFKTVAAAPRIAPARPNARVRFDEFCILSGIDRTKRRSFCDRQRAETRDRRNAPYIEALNEESADLKKGGRLTQNRA